MPSCVRARSFVSRSVTFYTGDITFPDDINNAIQKVSSSRRPMIRY